jgi:hypothetical protein
MRLILHDLTGQRFGRLTVIRRVESDHHRQTRWLCRCDCGVEREVRGRSLRSGHTKSCGCFQREMAARGAAAAAVTLAERFSRRVEKSDDGCWLWTGYRGRDGYGCISAGGAGGRSLLAHRVAWTIHNGPIPEGLNVLHKCDQPRCVRVDHLFLGTQADNMRDCAAKGRTVRGERSQHAKLSADHVREIRRRCTTGESQSAIASMFGVHYETVRQIVHRRNWSHIQ